MWVLCIVALVIISITHWICSWRNPRCNGKLPPGSMGWPLLGETLQFFSPNTSFDIPPFVKERTERYGSIFRTSLVGRPVIVSTDPDLNYFIFQQEGQLFQSWYPDTFTEIFGRQNVGSLHGFMYKYLKNMVLNLFGPESLKKMLPEVEQAACRSLQRWSCQDTLELKEATARGMELNGASKNFMAFGGGMRFCVGTDFTKVQMAVFLHCLVTKYRWKAIKGGDIVRTPGLQFPNGFHVQITEKNRQETTDDSKQSNQEEAEASFVWPEAQYQEIPTCLFSSCKGRKKKDDSIQYIQTV
ncbi:hypothetical protein L1049_006502 [Liquidambar formosana]|uniref:Cytochrome P450 n=1 Tax=Liquidambar formosana TaxID=63359 RepID=A0AAP0RH98_LIQFO